MTSDYIKKTGKLPASTNTLLDRIATQLEPSGLIPRGIVRDDAPADGARTLVLIGNAGPHMWRNFRRANASNLDSWTRSIIDPIAAHLTATAIYPFEGPPFAPFHHWALATQTVYRSPIGLLIDPEYGLWHAYRAALAFTTELPIPDQPSRPNPCETCADKPCLTTCPVDAFQGASFNANACQAYLASVQGASCLGAGCAARRACPVGAKYAYEPPQAAFHMRAFSRRPNPVSQRTGRGPSR